MKNAGSSTTRGTSHTASLTDSPAPVAIADYAENFQLLAGLDETVSPGVSANGTRKHLEVSSFRHQRHTARYVCRMGPLRWASELGMIPIVNRAARSHPRAL